MTWEGNRALRKLLTPVGELRPHPRNPRLGNVYEIGRSLERFGQQRPVLALPDGHRFTVVFYSLKQMWRCETRDESVALAAARRTARERQRFA